MDHVTNARATRAIKAELSEALARAYFELRKNQADATLLPAFVSLAARLIDAAEEYAR